MKDKPPFCIWVNETHAHTNVRDNKTSKHGLWSDEPDSSDEGPYVHVDQFVNKIFDIASETRGDRLNTPKGLGNAMAELVEELKKQI